MVKLERLRIGKYRNVKPGTELRFWDSLNVLLGRNGTGKTTLLNLIVQLMRWDFSQLQGEDVELEYTLRLEDAELTVQLYSEEAPGIPATAEHRLRQLEMKGLGLRERVSPRPSLWMIVRIVSGKLGRFTLKVNGSRMSVEDDQGSQLHDMERPDSMLNADTARNLLTGLLDIGMPGIGTEIAILFLSFFARDLHTLDRFDESLGFLSVLTEGTVFAVERIGNRSEERFSLVSCDKSAPGGLLDRIGQDVDDNPDVDVVLFNSRDENAEFLDRVTTLLGCKSIQLRLPRSSRTPGPHERIEFNNLRFDLTRRDGAVINHTLLSYGQKRLLSFYYYLASNPNCVVADELVNGMHHEWIEACLEDLGDRQAVLTSQNPLLLDYLSFDSAEEVQSSFVLCDTELQGDREQLVWRNMTQEDAEGFFRSYSVNIQHVSELLRTRGLW